MKKHFQEDLQPLHTNSIQWLSQSDYSICISILEEFYYNNRVYVRGHKYVLGPSQTHFSPRLAARAKMSVSQAQNIFMPKNINSITIIITLEGIEKIKTEKKMTTKQSEEYFFHQRCEKTSTNFEMASRF